jgi:hypothetical protein
MLETPGISTERFVIGFENMSEEEAREWPDLLHIVESKVKPERELLRNTPDGIKLQNNWWKWCRVRPALATAKAGKSRVLMHAFPSSHLAFAFIDASIVIASPHQIFVTERYSYFAALQNRTHEEWVRLLASSLEDRLRYTTTDCFETFPFPDDFEANEPLEVAGRVYYAFRADLMARNNEGLTKTYNRFHDPDERSPDIARLRELHAAMDQAVLEAYGWSDLAATARCEFLLDYVDEEDGESADGSSAVEVGSAVRTNPTGSTRRKRKPWRYRWPDDFRDEVLARLLELNKQRAEQERLTGLASGKSKGGKSQGKTSVTRGRKPAAGQGELGM